MRTSVVIAAYNEGPNIGRVVERVRAVLQPQDEVVVVDDGSVDNTAEVAAAAGAKVITQSPNQGKGRALVLGLEHAQGDVVVFIDGDGQDDPAEIPLLLAEMERGADMVNGSRFIGFLKEGAISRPNYYGNLFMTGLINLLFRVKITDSQAGFRSFRREKLRMIHLDAKEYEIETEMLLRAIKQRFRIVEVPVTRYQRGGGRTSFKRIRNGLMILHTILRLRLAGA